MNYKPAGKKNQGGNIPLRPHKHDHDHGDCCGHDHGHDHGHHQHEKPAGPLHRMFNRISGFTDRPLGLGLGAALLGTTALATPALNTIIGAGAVLASSLWLLKKSSDIILSHGGALAEKMKISGFTLGIGLAAMTAVPEAGIAIVSMLNKTAEVGIGTLVGSNIAHALLVLGAVAAVNPIARGIGSMWKYNTLAMTAATGLFAAQLATDNLSPLGGAALAVMTGAYLLGYKNTLTRDAKIFGKQAADLIHHHGPGSSCEHGHDHDHGNTASHASKAANLFALGTGLAGLAAVSHLTVESAAASAAHIGVSGAAISSLLVSFGAVLPELVVSVNASRQKKTDLAVGNVLGCNIFNILLVGTAMSAFGTPVPDSLSPSSPLGFFNLAALGTSTGLMTATLLAQKGEMKRWQGVAALGLYAGYLATTFRLGQMPEPPVLPAASPPAISAPAPKALFTGTGERLILSAP